MSAISRASSAVICSVVSVLAIVASMDHDLEVSPQGLAHIADMEGCRLKAYRCSADRWTAGLGHTSGVREGMVITEQDAAEFFVKDVGEAEAIVKRRIEHRPTQGEYDMMVSFVFHLGAGNFSRSTLLKKFNAGDNRGACDQYPHWVFVNGRDCREPDTDCAGIVERRDIEKKVCLNGWPE